FKTENRRMERRHKILTQKYFLRVFNVIFLPLGLLLLAFGLWLLIDSNNFFSLFFSSGENQLVAYISDVLLTVGSVIIFTSAVGFFGIVKETKCLLVVYEIFQIPVFVTQLAILILTEKEEVYNQWKNRLDEVVSEYGNESLAEQEPVWNILNAVQHNMKCCGRYNVTQWEMNKNKGNNTQIPCSCTTPSLKKRFCDVPRNSTYSVGCEEYLNTWFEKNVLILTAIAISLLITQVRVF
ncbi:CD82 protein, partial [Thinocorus orbignyianus]|nr:CD82 protein [Thinocorus orbignyianus]